MIDFDVLRRDTRYAGMVIPAPTEDTIRDYLLKGLPPGGFVTAMLAHDYNRALYNADQHNRQMFWAIAMWIRDNAPIGSHGSYQIVDAWVKDLHGVRTEFEKQQMWETLQDDTMVGSRS